MKKGWDTNKQENKQTDRQINLADVIGLLILLLPMAYAYKTYEAKYTEFNAKSYDHRQIYFIHLGVSTAYDEIKVDLDETIYQKRIHSIDQMFNLIDQRICLNCF